MVVTIRQRMDGEAMELLDWARFWNTTAAEEAADYPAHRYAIPPYRAFIRAVDVAAPPAVVFRWLCQLKVAPYSYDWVDNRGRRSPQELTPGVDNLATGQRLMIARIVEFEPDRHITAVSLPAATAVFGAMSLTYQITATAGGSRLVACLDVTARSWTGRLRRDLLAVGDLVMMRKQLLNLKALAERYAVTA
jgi:hypothetical protein